MRTEFGRPKRWTWRDRRLLIYIELRDLFVGMFVSRDAVYVVPFPCVVFRWARAIPGSRWAPSVDGGKAE